MAGRVDRSGGMVLIALCLEPLDSFNRMTTRGDLLTADCGLSGRSFLGAAPRYGGRDQARLDQLAVLAQGVNLPMVALGDALMHPGTLRRTMEIADRCAIPPQPVPRAVAMSPHPGNQRQGSAPGAHMKLGANIVGDVARIVKAVTTAMRHAGTGLKSVRRAGHRPSDPLENRILAGKPTRSGRITPAEWERRIGLRLRCAPGQGHGRGIADGRQFWQAAQFFSKD